MRKSANIVKIIETVNKLNKESTCPPERRFGWNFLLCEMLHDAGVYAGFNGYTVQDVPAGHLPGVLWNTPNGLYDHGATSIHEPGKTDESRVFYFVHKKLRK